MPSYVPLDWNPRKLQIIEPTPAQNNEQEQPPAGQKADPKPPPKDKPPPEVKCPPADHHRGGHAVTQWPRDFGVLRAGRWCLQALGTFL